MTATTTDSEPRTAAALAARRRNTQAALERVHDAITRLRREKTPVSVAAVARRADVSRTFLYTNADAKTAVADAIREARDQRGRTARRGRTTRGRRPGANGRSTPRTRSRPPTPRSSPSAPGSVNSSASIRDLEAEWTQDAIQRITTENTTLKQRVRQLTADNRTLDERLKAARSNLRFQDRRIADLEARVADPRTVS